MIPIGFNNSNINILTQNVIEYDAFFSVNLEKYYPKEFDNSTMFNWLGFRAASLNATVISFYGINRLYNTNGEIDIKSGFSLKNAYFNKTILFHDGFGLIEKDGSGFIERANLILICSIIFILF